MRNASRNITSFLDPNYMKMDWNSIISVFGALDMYWAVLDCTGLYWAVLGCFGLYGAVLGCIGLY